MLAPVLWNCRKSEGSPRVPVMAILGATRGGFLADLRGTDLGQHTVFERVQEDPR